MDPGDETEYIVSRFKDRVYVLERERIVSGWYVHTLHVCPREIQYLVIDAK